MKFSVYIGSALLLSSLLTGCGSAQDKKEVEQLRDQVLVVHDKVMPLDDEIMNLKETINGRIDSLTKAAAPDLKTQQEEGFRISKAMTDASERMSDWMHQYNTDTLKSLDDAQAKAYLTQQMTSIKEVEQKMTGSVDEAKKYLQKP